MALLKQKSKIIIERKPRKTYEVKPIFKKPKLPSGDLFKGLNQANKILDTAGKIDPKKKIVPKVIEHGNTEMTD